MLVIDGYKKVNYQQFINALKDVFDEAGKPYGQLIAATGKGPSTVQNIFKAESQKVPDKVLAQAAETLKFDCLLGFHKGKKVYFTADIAR